MNQTCPENKFRLEQMGHSKIELRDFMLSLGYERFIFLKGKLTHIKHDQFIQSDHIIEQYFMPREFVGNNIPNQSGNWAILKNETKYL